MDDLAIPNFLKRDKGEIMRPEDTQACREAPQEAEPSLEDLISTIKSLTAKRDEMNVTISGLKKQVQRLVVRI